jgi:hypothetical protein
MYCYNDYNEHLPVTCWGVGFIMSLATFGYLCVLFHVIRNCFKRLNNSTDYINDGYITDGYISDSYSYHESTPVILGTSPIPPSRPIFPNTPANTPMVTYYSVSSLESSPDPESSSDSDSTQSSPEIGI